MRFYGTILPVKNIRSIPCSFLSGGGMAYRATHPMSIVCAYPGCHRRSLTNRPRLLQRGPGGTKSVVDLSAGLVERRSEDHYRSRSF